MSKYRVKLSVAWTLFLATLPLLPRTVAAQQTAQAGAAKCDGRSAIGYLGISGMVCSNCALSYPGEGKPSLFATEPRISNIARNSPAASVLRVGDTVVSIDNKLITTIAGGLRLANLKPGETVMLEVRRNGEVVKHRFANLPAICPSDSRVLGSRARPGSFVQGRSSEPREQPLRASLLPGPVANRAPAAKLPRASFGFSFSCTECEVQAQDDGTMVWNFREPPEIYQVEAQSQAFRVGIRRGDVITRIDNTDILSAEGGRKFGQVRPGQSVKFSIRRGSATHTRQLLAQARGGQNAEAAPAVPSRARVASQDNSLRGMREMIDEMRRQEVRDREQIQQLRQRQGQELEELANRLLQQHRAQARLFDSLQAELRRTEQAISGQNVRQEGGPGRDRNTFRYAGKIGETDIEVRGPAGVLVNETPDSVIITTLDSTIRLKKSGRR